MYLKNISLQVNVSSGGISIIPDFTLKDLLHAIHVGDKRVDIVVVPGGVGVISNVCDKIKKDEGICNDFKNLLEMAHKVLTICTGSFIFPSIFRLGEDNLNDENDAKMFIAGNSEGKHSCLNIVFHGIVY